jgi:hypothetical protein
MAGESMQFVRDCPPFAPLFTAPSFRTFTIAGLRFPRAIR